jgi:transcriptional regulator with XRE-family HTH domain
MSELKGFSVFNPKPPPVGEYVAWTTIDDILGVIIHNYRKKKGLKQEELAVQVYRSREWLAKIEQGRHPCHLSAMIAMCWSLDLPFVELLQELDATEQDLRRDKVKVVFDVRDAEGTEYDKTQLIQG